MKKMTLADLITFLPKNAIIVNEAFYNDTTKFSGALVSSLLKYDKYKEYLNKQVIAINAVRYKTKAGIAVTFAPTTKPKTTTPKKTSEEK